MNHHPQQARTMAIIASGLLAVIAVAATVPAPATSQQPTQDVQRVAWSKDRAERPTDLDLGRKGPSPGDRLVTRGPLFDAGGSRRIGSYVGDFVTLNPRTLLVQTTLTATFSDGQLTVTGSLPFRRVMRAGGATLAITGGTGAYARARGTTTLRAHKIERNDGYLFTFDIVSGQS